MLPVSAISRAVHTLVRLDGSAAAVLRTCFDLLVIAIDSSFFSRHYLISVVYYREILLF